MTDAGLYIHVPFCTGVCPYCDFAVTIAGDERREAYLDALEREIELAAELGWVFDTVYLGGGTPSCLTPRQVRRMLDAVDARLDLRRGAVRHIEINPEDVSPNSVAAWRELGFDFVSLGVQSFADDALELLGRRHRAADARRAVVELVGAGFRTVSIDLIFGLPGQTAAGWRRQLETALKLGADHLSCYQLTVHEGTVFGRRRARGELDELDDDSQGELYLLTHDVLGRAGWTGYEVSNFAATPEHRSVHNRKYWRHAPYLGLGPAAHSFDGRRRWWNRRRVRLWTAALANGRSPVAGGEELTASELAFEAVMLGLRTIDGIDLEAVADRFGRRAVRWDAAAVDQLVAAGRMRRIGSRLVPTPAGMAVADGLVRAILR